MHGDPVIVVHDKQQAVAALEAAADHQKGVLLLSARYAAQTIGSLVFKEIVDQASRAVPSARFAAAIDCGKAAGRAMSALRAGLQMIVFDPASPAASRIADVAFKCDADVLDPSLYNGPLLDLETVGDPRRACDSYLIGGIDPDNH